MSAIKVAIHAAGKGFCSLTGKEADGLTVTFDDGTVKEAFLSWKSFRQLLSLKSAQAIKPELKVPATAAPANGAVTAGQSRPATTLTSPALPLGATK